MKYQVLEKLNRQIDKKLHLIGVSCGSGLTAKIAIQGGADMILALNSGRFRQMGVGSLSGFMPYANSNELVMEFGVKEMLPRSKDIPIIFGLNASDPTIILERYLKQIKEAGFVGINNYPTAGLFDGRFRDALEEQGLGYSAEIEAIGLAHHMGLFTIAFVFDAEQAEQMINAGADVICAHLGLTMGGEIGAKKGISLKGAAQLAQKIFSVCDDIGKNRIKMIYGGPINTSMDVEFMYRNSSTHGYIGGSTFDRTPAEETIMMLTQEFKSAGVYKEDVYLQDILHNIKKIDYINFIKQYISINFAAKISFSDLADELYISRSYLSSIFKKETGLTFPTYLNEFRINKACELLRNEKLTFSQIALTVGYNDYAHFNRTFKKTMGMTPSQFLELENSI